MLTEVKQQEETKQMIEETEKNRMSLLIFKLQKRIVGVSCGCTLWPVGKCTDITLG